MVMLLLLFGNCVIVSVDVMIDDLGCFVDFGMS